MHCHGFEGVQVGINQQPRNNKITRQQNQKRNLHTKHIQQQEQKKRNVYKTYHKQYGKIQWESLHQLTQITIHDFQRYRREKNYQIETNST